MSDKNIDKDLEILKEVQGIFEHLKIHGWINDIEREVDINKVILTISRAIEYIKNAELTKIACCTAQNCEALNNSIRLGKELETYKKMCEKLEQDNFILANENLNSVSKDKIQAEIEELKSKGRIINQTLPYRGEYKYHKEIKVLEKLLKS